MVGWDSFLSCSQSTSLPAINGHVQIQLDFIRNFKLRYFTQFDSIATTQIVKFQKGMSLLCWIILYCFGPRIEL